MTVGSAQRTADVVATFDRPSATERPLLNVVTIKGQVESMLVVVVVGVVLVICVVIDWPFLTTIQVG